MGKPKTPKAPPPPPPVAPAAIQDVSKAPEEAVKTQRRKSGYQKTVLTGNLTPKMTGKKTTLG